MNRIVIVLAILALLILSLSPILAQATDSSAPRGSYTYSVFNEAPLDVGTHVWVNSGDTRCAYNETGYPSATDKCMEEYKKATIVDVVKSYWWFGYWPYEYRVQIEGWEDNEYLRYRSTSPFDDLYELFNLPDEFAGYSIYFLALNW